MNKSELSEIRRRIHPEKPATDTVYGCYVNEEGAVITTFQRSLMSMPTEECDKYLALLRKVISGMPGKNLLEVTFRPDQVMEGEEHRLLMAMNNTGLKVEQSLDTFYRKVIDSYNTEERYLILLMHDNYDVPRKFRDDTAAEDASDTMFGYFLCAVCPVKEAKSNLTYSTDHQCFIENDRQYVVTPPELGFMFPSYEDGGANIYSLQYYTKDAAETHTEFVDGVFGGMAPMPAPEQKEAFDAMLSDTLEEDCSLEVVQSVHEHLRNVIEEKKLEKSPEIPVVTKKELGMVLASCGVAQEHVKAFEERYDEEFGPAADISAVNIAAPRSFEVHMPDVVVKVNPERSDLVETRIIDGARYILIRADEGVEVNGVSISSEVLGEDIE